MAGAPQPGAVVQHAHPGRGEEAHLGGDLLEGLSGAAVRPPRAASLPHPGQDHGHRTVEPRHTAKPTRSRPNHRRLQQTPMSSRWTRLRSAEAAWLQTLGATQHCLNPGFSERIGNSRRTASATRQARGDRGVRTHARPPRGGGRCDPAVPGPARTLARGPRDVTGPCPLCRRRNTLAPALLRESCRMPQRAIRSAPGPGA